MRSLLTASPAACSAWLPGMFKEHKCLAETLTQVLMDPGLVLVSIPDLSSSHVAVLLAASSDSCIMHMLAGLQRLQSTHRSLFSLIDDDVFIQYLLELGHQVGASRAGAGLGLAASCLCRRAGCMRRAALSRALACTLRRLRCLAAVASDRHVLEERSVVWRGLGALTAKRATKTRS